MKTEGSTFSPVQVEILAVRGIDVLTAELAGVRSARTVDELPEGCPEYWTPENGYLPGLLFPWASPTGRGSVRWQLRPDTPVEKSDGTVAKYVFGPGVGSMVTVGIDRAGNDTVVITEGTCQTIAFSSVAPEGVSVYGIAGCQSWMREGVPSSDLAVVRDREVFIALDADAATNRDVYDAGVRLREACLDEGAVSVRFLRTAGGKKAGLDDVLAGKSPGERVEYAARLIERARTRPKIEKPEQPAQTRPKAKRKSEDGDGPEWFDQGDLLAKDISEHILSGTPAALSAEGVVTVYRDGVFRIEADPLAVVTTELLGNRWRPGHHATIDGYTAAELRRRGQVLPDRMTEPIMNVANGMVDLRTGERMEWSPDFGSVVQFPVTFDPAARAPRYEEWAASQLDGQLEALEEAVSWLLDPSVTPNKAAFLFGPSRTGKGTFLRIIQAIAGPANTSAVSLHQLAVNKFMAAPLYGKALNVSGDLSAAHIEDISMFKMMTGEDVIEADRKYGKPFSFTNRALFAFSANELPTVGESSSAYVNRVKPFYFGHTFQGAENPSIEAGIMAELPGILNRWIAAWRDRRDRGRDMDMDERVLEKFATESDRVAMFVSHCTEIGPDHFSTTAELYNAFKDWVAEEGRTAMGKQRFGAKLKSVRAVSEARHGQTRARGWNVRIIPKKLWGDSQLSDLLPMSESERAKRAFSKHCKDSGDVVTYNDVDLQNTHTFHSAYSAKSLPALPGDKTDTYETGANVTTLPDGVLVFDIESGGNQLWPTSPDFVKIVGTHEGASITVSDDIPATVDRLASARGIAGHNVLGFDLIALAEHGLDFETMVDEGRVIDTMLNEVLINPPEAGTKPGQVSKMYSLDALGLSKFGVGKTDDLKALAEEFGGFDQIPNDDPRYRAYCAGDVALTSRLLASQGVRTAYAAREHRVAGIAARMRMNGFRVDVPLLAERVEAGRQKRRVLTDRLANDYGLPLLDTKGKPYKAPASSQKGKEAIATAFADLGVEVARTAKTDAPSLGKEAMEALREAHADNDQVLTLIETVQALNGIRSVYETVERCRVGDRVHPNITMYQASGRWSITEPGLTVMGKRGGRHVEREIFLPEPGHVTISADLSQVDARMVAVHCQDSAYMALFGPGMDSHLQNALAVWGDPDRRDDAKILGHGWNYGMGIAKLADLVGSEETAREFDRTMKDTYPILAAWKARIAEEADSGELLDNGWGRKLRTTPYRGWTQGPALIGQSAAMDCLKEGLLRMPKWIRPMLRAVVHDEVILSVPEDRVDEIERIVIDSMTFEWAPQNEPDYIPIMIEAGLAGRGVSWGACYAK